MRRAEGSFKRSTGPSSRRVMAVGIGALAASCLIVASRHEGYPEREIVTQRGTRWLVHRPTGSLVLADGVSGRVMVKLDTDRPSEDLTLAQGDEGAFLLDRGASTIAHIDEVDVQLEASRSIPTAILGVADNDGLDFGSGIGVSADGMIIAPRQGTDGFVVPDLGNVRPFDVGGDRIVSLVGSDGAVWSLLADGRIQRVLGSDQEIFGGLGLAEDTELTVIGTKAIALSRTSGQVAWYPSTERLTIPNVWQAIDAVVQDPTSTGDCVWIGFADRLLCLDEQGVATQIGLTDVQLSRSDRIAASDRTVVVIHANGALLSVDLSSGTTSPLGYRVSDVSAAAIAADAGSVWIDDPLADDAIVVTGPTFRTIDKVDSRAPVFSASGEPTGRAGSRDGSGPATGPDASGTSEFGGGIRPDDDALDEPPVAIDDDASGPEGSDLPINVAANDYDPDGGPIVVRSTSGALHGDLTIVNGNTVSYEPDAGFSGEDSFSYTIADETNFEASAEVRVRIIEAGTPNLPPIARPDSRETSHARSVVVDVLANDSDPEQAPLSIGGMVPPRTTEGTIERVLLVDGRQAIKFTPSQDYGGGIVRFTYRAVDVEDAESEPATVSVSVASRAEANRPPVATGDAAQGRAGEPLLINVLGNDWDPDGDDLVITRVEVDHRFGVPSIVNGAISFTPAASATGTISLRYVIEDRFGETASAVVLVVIIGDRTNLPPIARPDSRDVFGEPLAIDVVFNDVDPEGDGLSIVEFTRPDVGTVEQVNGRTLRYLPDPNATAAEASFSYVVADGAGNTASAVVYLRLNRVDQAGPPVATADNYSVTKNKSRSLDVLFNDRDPRGSLLSIVGTPTCSLARCTVEADGTITYVPDRDVTGTDFFTYRIRNGAGQNASGTVTVTITDDVVDLAPLARDDDFKVRAGEEAEFDVLANDVDPENGPLRLVKVTSATDGTIPRINANGRVTFLAANAAGTATNFFYDIVDAGGQQATGRVSVRIIDAAAPRLPPSALPDVGTLIADSVGEFDVLTNDTDPDGPTEALQVRDARVTSGLATTTIVGGRFIRVVPASGFVGQLRITYSVFDADDLSATSLLTVEVSEPPNTAPDAADDAVSTPSGQAVTLAVLGNDVDPDGDPLTIRLQTSPSPSAGSAEVVADLRQIRFTPLADFQGTTTFSYVAVDGRGLSSRPATVSITVLACAQSTPIVRDRLAEFTPFDTTLALDLLDSSQLDYSLTAVNVVGGTIGAGGRPGSLLFIPTPGSNGGGSFTYVVKNNCGSTRNARVAIDVNRAPLVNVATAIETEQDQPITVDITQIASDDEPITFARADTGGVGTAQIVNGGRGLVYTPPAGYRGAPELRVSVVDPGGLTTDATMRVIVNPPTNIAPIAFDDASGFSLTPGQQDSVEVLGNDRDPDGANEDLRVQLMSQTVTINGVAANLSLSADGRRIVVDVPAGVHGTGSFSYRAVDAAGAQSEPAKVIVYANRKPTELALTTTLASGSTLNVPVAGATSPDPDGDPVTLAGERSDNSFVSVSVAGTNLVVTAAPGSGGTTATILFSIVDSYGAWSVSSLVVTVTEG